MFMGLFAHMFGVSSILFTSQRVGDITVWYQSSRLQHGPEWAMKDQIAEASYLLPSRKIEENLCMTREFWKIPLSIGIIRSSKDLV